MDRGTAIGGPGGRFLPRLSVVLSERSDDAAERQRAFGRLASLCWKPLYKHVRLR